ncbi:AbrB family transcriptional regulator [Aestuariirhabdus sp. Z084]|uniref:AbrB family transcriptional regulator n=1 Tax=Aestuariirhabdus haliotis TaxID=2918751 RepID=UPI00201B4166|nr:AbrB family transcriptional regulator [Aestuariirhabdus haliotis]MCL6415844.1 AbrB family transcriptional regulator [Aestuariirhabdus haliotis]MCL6419854.1 AbrB family transcriptional regulator [Aestuariirhabdus haliotis]
MSLFVTFLLGSIGGALAFYFQLPLPWLLGSLLAVIIFRKLSLVKSPPKLFSRWMRIFLGVALGGAMAESVASFEITTIVVLASAVVFVILVTVFGVFYFRRLPNFSSLDSFMSALPGGLTFLVSMSGNLGDRFPKIALIHTVRMVALILVFSLFAFFLGAEERSVASFDEALAFHFDLGLWPVLLLALASGLFADKANVAGGDIMFPLIISAAVYGVGWVDTPMPELITTLAMITFGAVIGCKITQGEAGQYKPQIKASLFFSAVAIGLALGIAVVLGGAFDQNYFLFFLALAPGSIPEMCVIAIAMGFDVGFVALIHTCRYLFIMFVGALGFNLLNGRQEGKERQEDATPEKA